MRRCTWLTVCLCPFLAVLSGCGPADDGGPTRVPVEVTVMHNGSPVEDAHVTFVPKGEGQAAFGLTGAEGKAELSTQGDSDGAIPGEYDVTVKKTETEGPDVQVDPNDPGAMPENAESLPPSETRNLLPEKYSAIGTTDLKATVTEEGENTFTFELTD